MTNYVVASSKDWFKSHPKSFEYARLNVVEISKRKDLSLANLKKINPRYIFFPHWSWRIDPDIYEHFECVVFHTTPLPYGRGGSPIQNLIIRGFERSPVCAIRVAETLDGGPIYDSIEVDLSGNVTEIFSRIAFCVEQLILKICKENVQPKEQFGSSVLFSRLSYADNELKSEYSMKELYDRIRMVDGLDYPKAYITFGKYKLEISEAILEKNELRAMVKMQLKTDKD